MTKVIILLCSLPDSYDHLVTTLTYGKHIISLDVITSTLSSHSQRRQHVEEGNQGDGLYVKGSQDCGHNKDNGGSRKNRQKSRNRKVVECYSCKQIEH